MKRVMKEVLLMKICKKYFFGHFFSIITSPGSRPLAAVARSARVMSHEAAWSWSASPPIKTLARDPASVELTTPTQVSWRRTEPRLI